MAEEPNPENARRYGRGATPGDGGVAGAPASFQLITELKIMLNSP